MNKILLPRFIFVESVVIIFVSGQMEPGTVDSLTIKIVKVASCINRKSTYVFSFESFQIQKLKREEHWDCKEKPKDKFLKIFCSLGYFLKWILFSDLFWLDSAYVIIDVQIKWLFWWRGIYNTGLGYYWKRLTDKYCPLCWKVTQAYSFSDSKKAEPSPVASPTAIWRDW